MKKRVETTIDWTFPHIICGEHGILSRRFGWWRLSITQVGVKSYDGGRSGMFVVYYDEANLGKVHRDCLNDDWRRVGICDGNAEFNSLCVHFCFSLKDGEKSFCDAAVIRMVGLCETFGINRRNICRPRVTQETFVWVPNSAPIRLEERGRVEVLTGWVDFGSYLAAQHLIAQPSPVSD